MQLFKPLLRTYGCHKKCYGALQQIIRSTQTNIRPCKVESFQRVLPKVIDTLGKSEKFCEIPQVKEYLLKIFAINVEDVKKRRGLTTAYAYEMLEKPENITEHSMELACVLGWCVEMVHAFLVTVDDIMDNSQTRHGGPCWYRQLDVGRRAVNDCILIRAFATEIIKLYFHEKPFHTRLIETIDHALFQAEIGQHLYYVTAHMRDYNQFTIERYNTIVKYKIGSAYNLAVSLALILCNIADKETFKLVEEISVDIGVFFQLQDDFMDVYGDLKITGKEGTDILEGNCSWLAVTALPLCTPQQRVVFKKCYGSKEPAHKERIKLLFDKLNLRQHYLEHEDKQYRSIKKKIRNLPPHISHELFNRLIDNIIL